MARTKKQVVKKSESEKIREMDIATIEKNIEELKQELFNLRFQAAVGKLENTAQIKKNKADEAKAKRAAVTKKTTKKVTKKAVEEEEVEEEDDDDFPFGF